MVFNDTFKNISAISRKSVLLVDETGVPGENHRPAGFIRFYISILSMSDTNISL